MAPMLAHPLPSLTSAVYPMPGILTWCILGIPTLLPGDKVCIGSDLVVLAGGT